MKQSLYIGIDCGGTRTGAVLCDAQNRVLKSAQSGPSNYLSVGMDAAVSAVRDAVEALGRTSEVAALALGSSALDECTRDAQYRAFCAALFADELLSQIPLHFVESDARMALYGLTGGESGALLISGTGVMGLAQDGAGNLHTVAGFGDRLMDAGSGFSVGLFGILAALSFADGIDDAGKALHTRLLSHYALSDARAFLTQVYAPDYDKSLIASFSETVAELAQENDAASVSILHDCADTLFSYAKALCKAVGKEKFSFGIYGSVLQKDKVVRERFLSAMRREFPAVSVEEPGISAEQAAALYAQRRSL